MSRDSAHYLEDMIEACEKVIRYSQGMKFDEYVKANMASDAVERNLGIIGEAAKKLPDEMCNAIPDVEWRKIKGLRDILTHEYLRVDESIVWDVVTNKIPELLSALTRHRDSQNS